MCLSLTLDVLYSILTRTNDEHYQNPYSDAFCPMIPSHNNLVEVVHSMVEVAEHKLVVENTKWSEWENL